MNPSATLRRLSANPRVALALLAALGVYVWWRNRGGGGGGGGADSLLEPPLGTVATGDFSSLPVDPEVGSTAPVVIPTPDGGLIVIPPGAGADPIVYPPMLPPAAPPPSEVIPTPGGGQVIVPGDGREPIVTPPPPAPAPPPAAPPGGGGGGQQDTLKWAGRTFRRNEGAAFRAYWRGEMAKRNRPHGDAAWTAFRRNNPGIARFFGFAVPGASSSSGSRVAAAPAVQPAAGSLTAAGTGVSR